MCTKRYGYTSSTKGKDIFRQSGFRGDLFDWKFKYTHWLTGPSISILKDIANVYHLWKLVDADYAVCGYIHNESDHTESYYFHAFNDSNVVVFFFNFV